MKCTCSKEKKIPVKDIPFIKGQREKVGSKGPHQMGLADVPEHKRQMKAIERKEKEEDVMLKRMQKELERNQSEEAALHDFYESENLLDDEDPR